MALPRERAERILALRDQGMTLRAIAAQVGCAPHTVGGYVHRRRTPGRRATPKRALSDFVDYCRQRLTDDPDLTAPALFGELVTLGYPGSRPTFYRDLGRYDLLRPASQNTRPRPGYPPKAMSSVLAAGSTRPLPIRVAPVAGEPLGSYLARVAAANHIPADDLLSVLPGWIRRRIARDHSHSTRHDLTSTAEDALRPLSVIAGVTQTALAHALPAFTTALPGGQPTGPTRITTACRRCTANRGIRQPVPVRLPITTRVCVRHGIWLSGHDRPQLDVNICPEIAATQKRTWHLLRRTTPQQLTFTRVTAEHLLPAAPTPSWHQRLRLLHAAIYPDALDHP